MVGKGGNKHRVGLKKFTILSLTVPFSSHCGFRWTFQEIIAFLLFKNWSVSVAL